MAMYDRAMMSQVHPSHVGSFQSRSGRALRPWRQLTAMGIAYERSRVTTAAEMMALNALYLRCHVSKCLGKPNK